MYIFWHSYTYLYIYVFVFIMCRSKSRSRSRTRSHFTTRSGVCKRDLYRAKETYMNAYIRAQVEAELGLASFIAQIYVKETHIFPKETYMNAYIRAQVEAELGLASLIAQIYVKETHIFPKETYICAKETCVCVMHKRASLIEAEPRLVFLIV